LNSWMQTPTGHEVIDGVVYAKDWMEIIFNPSFPYRFSHMLIASGLTAAFLMAGLSAYRLLRGDNKKAPHLTLKTSIFLAAILIPLQIFVGDLHGLNTLEHQPQKVAAMEGVWQTEKGAPLLLFAIPDEQTRSNHYEIAIPNMASIILTHDPQGEIRGLDEFKGEHSPVAPVFFGFRIMVGIGMLMLLVSWFVSFKLIRGKTLSKPVLRVLVGMTFSGWIATLAGWYVTEIGRQPYLVSGLLKTKDAVTDIAPTNVVVTFILFISVFAVLLIAYLHTLFAMARNAVEIEEIQMEEHALQPNFQLEERDNATTDEPKGAKS
ncbi:MAG: cytochrome d ubiquinol oxidase subunit I, partial [Paraglaciecola sp.]